ncbi:PP2C family protein-serine/threonine phosphatase [Streptomyces sp. NPDC088732]|uniref:PP2C family protein-serine/threonine phosphatase n=1 Tax=Streptomyces sp. NPDC088732 TaxID=3365879 RepID=UPI00382F2D70
MRSSRRRKPYSGGPALRVLDSVVPVGSGILLPLLLIIGISLSDWLSGPQIYLAPMMVMAPALASVSTTWRRTLGVGAAGLVAQLALLPYDEVRLPDTGTLLRAQLVAYVVVSLFGTYIAWRYEQGRRVFAAVHSVAEAAQRALLLPPGPVVGDLRLAVRYVSAADTAQIGGDLYTVVETPHGVRALIGDVRGKGLDAVQTASVTLGSFREAAYDEETLTRVAQRVDASVARHMAPGEFTTALFLQFNDPGQVGLLHYGHVPPLRVAPDGTVTSLDPPDPWVPLGLSQFATGLPPRPWQETLGPDDVLVLCTDGVIEARSVADGSFYPLAERAARLAADSAGDLEAAVERLYADLLRHTGGGLSDDALLMLVARS